MSRMLHFPATIDWHWVWLSVAAFLAGVLNAVAGGGSFLLFPAMLGMKMLPVQANATNTVALVARPAHLGRRLSRRHSQEPPPGLADGPGRTAGRHRRGRGPAEHAANDISAPGAVAAAGGRIHLCRHRAGLALAGTAARSRPARATHPPDCFPCFSPPSSSAFTSATSAPARAFCSSPCSLCSAFRI